MTNKIYENIKKFIKENYKFLIIYGIILLLFTVSLDYEVYTPGSLSNLKNRIEVENGYESKGSFNLTYVSAKKGTIPFILLSYIIPSWDLVSLDDIRIENEDYDDILTRGKIDLESVNENAIAVAFETANLDYEITKNELTIYYIFENAKTNLKVGDKILEVEGQKVTSTDDLTKIFENRSIGDEITFKIERDGKTLERKGTLYQEDDEDRKIIGLYLTNVVKVKTKRNIDFNYKGNESGASGGLMSTLEIYNRITEKDITKGLKIAGTGTIKLDGTVGEIGGVKYKLAGAAKKKADVFIVPSGNYEEALEIKEKMGYDITLIEAKTFKGVLNDLEKLGE